MKVKSPIRFTLSLLAALLLVAPVTLRAQDARSALTNFPESQAIMYINARRLINDAAPSFMPPEVFNKALADAKQFIDLQGLEYMVAGVRLKGEPSAKNLPEFLLIVRGNFSANALLSGARMMGQGMYAQETHGGKTLNVFTLNKPAPPGAADGGNKKSGQQFPVDQIAAVALDANTLAIGIPAYLRDAIDTSAGGGQGARLKPELIDLALRDENTIVSVVGEMPASVSKYMHAVGMPPNAEMDKIIDAVRQMRLSWNMMPGTFGVQSIMRMDSPESAATLSGLVTMGANVAKGEMAKDAQKKTSGDREDMASLLRVLETLTNVARDNEVTLGLTFQQASLAEMVKRQLAPKPPKPSVAPPAKKAPAPRRTVRPRKR